MTITNNLDRDQTQRNVGPDLDPNCLTLMVFLIFEKKLFKKKQQTTKKHEKLPSRQRVMSMNLDTFYLNPNIHFMNVWILKSIVILSIFVFYKKMSCGFSKLPSFKELKYLVG